MMKGPIAPGRVEDGPHIVIRNEDAIIYAKKLDWTDYLSIEVWKDQKMVDLRVIAIPEKLLIGDKDVSEEGSAD
jgi:hypothetical protein